MDILMPQKVKFIIKQLMDNGFEAYAVGGCVRDSILGREPNDWDITTSALPGQVKKVFEHTVDTGIQHGTVTVVLDKENFEVTTYRIDGEYEDNRHPKEVIFTANLVEDLKRRDFTVNAMAYNDEIGLVDVFGGISDLNEKIIRCVGNAEDRFSEDALRVLRAARFAAQLGFSIEDGTMQAMKSMAPNLANISAERIQVELVKLIISDNPDMIKTAYELGITKIVLPEFDKIMNIEQNNPHHIYTVGEHTLYALKNVRADKSMRLAVLFHDFGKADTQSIDDEGISHFYNHAQASESAAHTIMRRLKFDNDTLNRVKRLVKWHDYRFNLTKKSMRRSIHKIGEDIFTDLLEVMRADVLAQSSYLQKEKLQQLEEIKNMYENIINEGDCLRVKSLAVNGSDLIKIGVSKGPKIGDTLNYLLEIVFDSPKMNNKEILLKKAAEYNDL